MNSASWKSVTYCRTVGKETQKILFNSQIAILLSKYQVRKNLVQLKKTFAILFVKDTAS